MSKRIAFINTTYGVGSTGKIVEQLHNSVKENGYESLVIYSRNNTIDTSEVRKVYSSYGFYHHVINALVFDKHGLYSNQNTDQIIELLEEFKPDLINLHNVHGFYLNYVKLMGYIKSKQIPVVLTLHDCWTFTGFCSHYEGNQCSKWMNGCKECKFRNVYPYRLFGSNSENNFKLKQDSFNYGKLTIVTPSLWLQGEVSKSMLWNRDIYTITNSINTQLFKKDNTVVRSNDIILAVSNIWTKHKGIDDLIILTKLLNDNKKLIVVGKGSSKLKGIESYERLPQEMLVSLYKKASCFVNLTYEDTYPTVNLEALLCGCPVITYRSGGSSELCNHKDNIVDKGRIEEVAKLINDNSFVSKVNYPEPKNMCVEYIKLFNSILEV